MPSAADVLYLKSTASRSYAEKFRLGSQPSMDSYRVSDDDMAAGSTLGAARICCVLKATGAIEKVFCVDAGANLIGTVLLQHWDTASGTRIDRLPGTFGFHPEYQDHDYLLANGLEVTESVFVLNTADADAPPDPPLLYVVVRYCNTLPEPVEMDTYAFCDLAGETSGDIDARYDVGRNGIVAWNHDQRNFVRFIGASIPIESWEVSADRGKAVGIVAPGRLANRTTAKRRPLGILRLQHRVEPDCDVQFSFVVSVSGDGERTLRDALAHAPPALDALSNTRAHFRRALQRAQLTTPNPDVNHGVIWAKANMLRVQLHPKSGWCFTNDPTRSTKSVGRDTAMYSLGSDFVTPKFSRDALCAYLERQDKSGKIVEWYDMLTGETEDYGLNISDNTPLLILAIHHHAICTGDREFLRRIYPRLQAAAAYILRNRDRRGLVWCTSTETGSRGIAGWRNVIQNYRISGAPTELNSECYGALRSMAQIARAIGRGGDADRYERDAAALRAAVNKHLYNPQNGLYLLTIDVDGTLRTEVTIDLVFPVLYGVADGPTAEHIVRRLSADDFWTSAGLRTVPHDSPDYSPDAGSGLLGGVWVGVAFWYALCASQFLPEKMEEALATTFQNYSRDPRRSNTVPGQFSEWLDGETLVNQGMMLSPWFPPRYLWAAIEGAAGFRPDFDGVTLAPQLPPAWSWVAVRKLVFANRTLSWFFVRQEDGLRGYGDAEFSSEIPIERFDADISDDFDVSGDDVSAVALRNGRRTLLFLGNSSPHSITTRIRTQTKLPRRMRSFDGLSRRWGEKEIVGAHAFQNGYATVIGPKAYRLFEFT